MIAKLKREVQQLKDELALATGQQYESELTHEDKERYISCNIDYQSSVQFFIFLLKSNNGTLTLRLIARHFVSLNLSLI